MLIIVRLNPVSRSKHMKPIYAPAVEAAGRRAGGFVEASLGSSNWVVVKVMVPFWVPIIIRTTTQLNEYMRPI